MTAPITTRWRERMFCESKRIHNWPVESWCIWNDEQWTELKGSGLWMGFENRSRQIMVWNQCPIFSCNHSRYYHHNGDDQYKLVLFPNSDVMRYKADGRGRGQGLGYDTCWWHVCHGYQSCPFFGTVLRKLTNQLVAGHFPLSLLLGDICLLIAWERTGVEFV